MKVNRIILVMIAAVAIGMFALPSTLSFNGSMHTFRQVDATDASTVNAFCLKCHDDDINAQLAASDDGLYNGQKIHNSVQCQGCHQITRPSGGNGYGVDVSSTEHAARLPSCRDCHITGGYLMAIGNAAGEIRATTEAHKNFLFADDDDLECIGCHTDVARSGTITYNYQSQARKFANLTIG